MAHESDLYDTRRAKQRSKAPKDNYVRIILMLVFDFTSVKKCSKISPKVTLVFPITIQYAHVLKKALEHVWLISASTSYLIKLSN